MMHKSPLDMVRACMQAYADKDRAAIEELIGDDYRFTSPIDNGLDRATYFRICWPNSAAIEGFDEIYGVEDGERAFIVYEARMSTGSRLRNCEVHTTRNGKLVATEVYFGWDVPHKVHAGTHAETEGQGQR